MLCEKILRGGGRGKDGGIWDSDKATQRNTWYDIFFLKKMDFILEGFNFFKGSIFSKDEDIIKKSLETFKIAYECHNPPLKVQKIF